jgi:hypothetical protein
LMVTIYVAAHAAFGGASARDATTTTHAPNASVHSHMDMSASTRRHDEDSRFKCIHTWI